jgi:hypothetical protein
MKTDHVLITRGRNREPEAVPSSALRGGLAVLLVGLSAEARRGLVAGQPVHLRVPIGGEGILDLVIVGDDVEVLPPAIETVLANAAAVVQVSDQEEE